MPLPGEEVYFNPRSPCGERPALGCAGASVHDISIHAPRVGSDATMGGNAARAGRHFNPRSPCGERLIKLYQRLGRWKISIHAPRVGSDLARYCEVGR